MCIYSVYTQTQIDRYHPIACATVANNESVYMVFLTAHRRRLLCSPVLGITVLGLILLARPGQLCCAPNVGQLGVVSISDSRPSGRPRFCVSLLVIVSTVRFMSSKLLLFFSSCLLSVCVSSPFTSSPVLVIVYRTVFSFFFFLRLRSTFPSDSPTVIVVPLPFILPSS